MRRSNPSKALRNGLIAAGAAALLLATAAAAQRAGTEDCSKPGNCAGGIKPGGVEHAPEADSMRALKMPAPPAVSAPAPVPAAPVGAARPPVPPATAKTPKKSDK